MPPWNPITGHLLCLAPLLSRFPKDIIQNYLLMELSKDFSKTDNLLYLDLWPFSMPMIVVTSPDLSIQACQQHDLTKPAALKYFLEPFSGGEDLFTMNGLEWKRSRAMFAPGFNANYLLGQMGHILEETSVFVEILREHARKGDMFSLDRLTCDFTMDIIGAVCLNSHLNSQRQFNPLASAMRSQIAWHLRADEMNLFKRWNPAQPLIMWKNSRTMNNYIGKELDKRFIERQGGEKDTSSRSIIDLVLDNYMTENSSLDMAHGLDQSFKKWAQVQIRLMIFAGHDSTASTICYSYYLLSKHPNALAQIRAEHNEVFGTHLKTVSAQLLENPQLINKLSYTNAVLKETLRLFPRQTLYVVENQE
ncbi:Cytochrome P450 59 [Hyphodiscus hymeniophilus]|uniref:Cytochrome P450 59 n=1 Tax=Hyphodiscus hymeniophilus TaxID=353542 RepID=A0A9P6VQ54_9HELO|nr:Cytochrome P450 59 [Hyphodiscus hymeniophilus]